MELPVLLQNDARKQARRSFRNTIALLVFCLGVGLGGTAMLAGSVDCGHLMQKTANDFVSAALPKLIKLPFSS
jgi:hypothetical protein